MTKICQALGVSRSNLYEQFPKAKKAHTRKNWEDEIILPVLRAITDERPTYGYRRVTALLRKRLNKPINPKRGYRIMKANNLLLQRYPAKPVRVHEGKVVTLKSNLRWCSDTFSIQCWNSERVHIAFAMDCHDREVISWVASSVGIDGSLIRDLMAESVEIRFGKVNNLPHRVQWLSDNGPCYVARETIRFGRSLGFEVCTTAPYSPESNGMAEAFVKTFKRDYAYLAELNSGQRVIDQLSDWFEHYNNQAPHKGLKMLSPREYRQSVLAVG